MEWIMGGRRWPARLGQRLWGIGLAAVLLVTGVGVPPLSSQTVPRRPRTQPAGASTTSQAIPPAPTSARPAVSSTSTESAIDLSLEEAIRLALAHNLTIKRERFGPQIARTEVLKARAAFHPVAGVDAQFAETKSLPTTRTVVRDAAGNIVAEQIIHQFSHRDELTPRLRQQLITGGNYEVRFLNSREDISPSQFGATGQIADPRFESRLELSFTQPLLRDFGIAVNTTAIRQAEKNELIAEQQVLQAILDTLFSVQQQYWVLVFRHQDLEVKRESQRLAQTFFVENQLRVELGLLPPVELVQAEARVKTRENDVIRANAAVREAEDRLKEILNIAATAGTWRIRLRPTDTPLFAPLPGLRLEEQVAMALKQRPDFAQSQLDIAIRTIARDFARNQRLPRLDLTSLFSIQAFGDGWDASTRRLGEAEGYSWAVGLLFEQPLGNHAARQELRKRGLELQQATLDQERLLLSIMREIDQAIRDIETFGEQVEVTRAATVLAQRQLEAEEEKFRLGLSTSFNVLEFQEDLSLARTEETRTLSDYNVALARLDQVTGTLQAGPR